MITFEVGHEVSPPPHFGKSPEMTPKCGGGGGKSPEMTPKCGGGGGKSPEMTPKCGGGGGATANVKVMRKYAITGSLLVATGNLLISTGNLLVAYW